MAKSQRNSDVELLRIISIFAIVFGHFIGESGSYVLNGSVNDFFLVFLGSGGRIAVNIFLLIGVWYMVDSKFRAERVLKLYLQVFFYCYLVTIIMLFVRSDFDTKSVIRAFFPLTLRPLWFASAYITLMLFKPFLDKILQWEKRRLILFIGMLFVFVSFICTISEEMGYVIDTVWFGIVYLFVGIIKKYPIRSKTKIQFLIIGMGGYLVLTAARYYSRLNINSGISGIIDKYSTQYIQDIKSLPNFIIAFCIFYWVINLRERHSKIINFMSVSTFSVYIIHQVPVFYPFLWANIFMAEKWLPEHSVIYVLIVTVIVFTACSLIDIPRRKFFEPAVSKSKPFKWAEKKINNIFNQLNVGEEK